MGANEGYRNKHIEVHDELEAIKALLSNKLKNHYLDEVVKEIQITKLEPEDIGDYPCIRLVPTSYGSISLNETEGMDGELVADTFEEGVLVEIIMQLNQDINYNGIEYRGAENGLYVIRDIVITILAENQVYEDEERGIAWSNVDLGGIDWVEGYLDDPDAVALSLLFVFMIQKVRTEV